MDDTTDDLKNKKKLLKKIYKIIVFENIILDHYLI